MENSKKINRQPAVKKTIYYYIEVVVKEKSSRCKVYLAERLYGLNEDREDVIKSSIKEDQELFETELANVLQFEIVPNNSTYTFDIKNRFIVDNFWLTPANETMNKSFRSRAIINKLISIRKGGK